MLRRFFSKPQNPLPHVLYGSVVAQSRKEVFYTSLGFRDEPMARYELLATHMFLLSNALRAQHDNEKVAQELGQEVFDLFTDDVERGLRAFGFGDTSVSKRKKKLAHKFYALIDTYGDAIDAGDLKALALAFIDRSDENLCAKPASKSVAKGFSAYMLASVEALGGQIPELISGKHNEPHWPDPATFVTEQKPKSKSSKKRKKPTKGAASNGKK